MRNLTGNTQKMRGIEKENKHLDKKLVFAEQEQNYFSQEHKRDIQKC